MIDPIDLGKRKPSTAAPAWVPVWPRPLSLTWLALAVFALVCSVIAAESTVRDVVTGNLGLVTVGVIGTTVLLVFCRGSLTNAGIDIGRVPRSVRITTDDTYGGGVALFPKFNLIAVKIFFAIFVFELSVAAFDYLSRSDSPLPPTKPVAGNWVIEFTAAGAALLVALILLRCRSFTVFALYAGGIGRRTTTFRPWQVEQLDTFVRWEEIDELQAQIEYVRRRRHTAMYPVLRIVSSALDPKRRLLHLEEPGSTVIRLRRLSVDPNSLFALMLWCKDNPWARSQLAGSDARELLQPPPLRERLRLSNIASPGKYPWLKP